MSKNFLQKKKQNNKKIPVRKLYFISMFSKQKNEIFRKVRIFLRRLLHQNQKMAVLEKRKKNRAQ